MSKNIILFFLIVSCFLTIIFAANDLLVIFQQTFESVYADDSNKIPLQDFNFVAAGDWACTGQTIKTVDNMVKQNPELVLGLGDYAYGRPGCWLKIVDPIVNKMDIVIGNHEPMRLKIDNGTMTYVPAPERLQQYIDRFNLTKQYYSFNYQNVHFVAMSTETEFGPGSAQYIFVNQDLARADSDPSIKWIVVFYHRLAYTSPSFVGSVPLIRDTYHPLFVKYNVDLVIQAHNHNYQRTYPIIYNSSVHAKPIITDFNETNYRDLNGQIFLIVGTAGSPFIHNFTRTSYYMANQFNAYGFLNIDVTNNGSTFVGTFNNNNGSTNDKFVITKSRSDLVRDGRGNNSNGNREIEPRIDSRYQNEFIIQRLYDGLNSPTSMTFLAPQDILVLEKNNGTVRRIVNGTLFDKPLLDVNVANKVERGMVGIASTQAKNGTTIVFLYYTESKKDGDDICPKANYCISGSKPIANRLYKYELADNGTKLVKPTLLLDMPALPGPGHNGGRMIIGPDGNIYTTIGDLMGHQTKAENYENGSDPDGTGGILRIKQDGKVVGKGILGNMAPLDKYYAYGIRNSFGLDFDPVTGNLWDTENGPEFGDEINLVLPAFNSGWKDVQGLWYQSGGKPRGLISNDNITDNTDEIKGLVDFDKKGKYRSPEFTWFNTVGPTAIKFLNSNNMGKALKNDLFVADIHHGNIYHFELDDSRTRLLLDGPLSDRVANIYKELEPVIFAKGFGGITDLQVGPDGYLYVLSYSKGSIYRIIPRSDQATHLN